MGVSIVMKLRSIGLVLMCSVLTGCSSWIPSVANNGINYGVSIGQALSADRSLYNVMYDLTTKNTINNALLDNTLILNVSTDVYQGIVMLTGFVKDEETRKKAEDLARKVEGVREIYNDIQVTDETRLLSLPKDLLIETALSTRMVLEPGVTSVNYMFRATGGTVYILGIAKSRSELDQVIALTRTSGARKIVSHVFLTEQIVLDGAPAATAEAKAAPAPVQAVSEPAPAVKTKSDAKETKRQPVPRAAPPRTAAP